LYRRVVEHKSIIRLLLFLARQAPISFDINKNIYINCDLL